MKTTLALFGEAEKGSYDTAYFCHFIEDVYRYLGNKKTKGLSLATQGLTHGYDILYFRVQEEGYSLDDYFFGLQFLNAHTESLQLAALALPGVGDLYVIEAVRSLCQKYHCLLLVSDQDLYDLVTYS